MFAGMVLGSVTVAAEPSAWPRFRGPNGSGVAETQQPPTEIGPEKNVKWKVAVPSGMSSPIVAGELLVITAFDDGKLWTIAYRRADGSQAWRADAGAEQIEPFHKTESSPAASTPATDGERIVSYFGSCGLVCYDLSGRELWRHAMPPAAVGGGFGSGVSPIIAEGLVILVRDVVQDPKLIALDAVTGALRWETKRQSPTSYSTPVVWDSPAGKQIVVAGHARLSGYDLSTGAERWTVNGIPSGCCPSPVAAEGGVLFAGGGPGGTDGDQIEMPSYDKMLADLDKDKDGTISRDEGEKTFEGFFDSQDMNKDGKIAREEFEMVVKFLSEGRSAALAVRPGGSGDVTESHVVWKTTKGLPYVASAIAYRGQYVMVKDGGVVTAYDPQSGEQIYQRRAAATGTYYASLVAAGGNLYMISLNDGTLTVLKGGAKSAEVVATSEPLGERVAATPAIADHTLYVRTAAHLYAFAAR
jgi:outer membrane protein assembly factor BamB